MAIKQIVGFVFGRDFDAPVIAALQSLAGRFDAHATCVLGGVIPASAMMSADGFSAGMTVQVVEYVREQTNAEAAKIEPALKAGTADIEFAILEAIGGEFERLATLRARHADLSIVRRPDAENPQPHVDLIENVLLGSGHGLLVVPPGWNGQTIGGKVAVAWDGSRESARALTDSLALLQPGAEISIITVDAKPTGDRHGEAPGHDVALYLARHGYKATVRNEDSLGADVVEVLLDVMHAEKTDLLVMGGYRHPRLQQSLFGGVTRSMLAVAETPLFLSH